MKSLDQVVALVGLQHVEAFTAATPGAAFEAEATLHDPVATQLRDFPDTDESGWNTHRDAESVVLDVQVGGAIRKLGF